ncbi:MAG TPA: methyl-accepting chemotaxis protein [Burkholderiaceae bacterium]|nr:methyl-accepting chemotaxis protein [Burkholderiaceae bacterium]
MKFLGHIGIAGRLGLGFGFLLVISLLVAAFGVQRILVVGAIADRLGAEDAERLELSQRWARAIEANAARSWVLFHASDARALERVEAEQRAVTEATTGRIKRLEELATSAENQALIARISVQRQAYVGLRSDLIKRRKAGESIDAVVNDRLVPAAAAYLEAVQAFADHQRESMQATRAEARAATRSGVLALALGTALALVAGTVIVWRLSRSITGPIGQANRLATAIAEGDLTSELAVEGEDEIARMLRSLIAMQTALTRIVAQVRASSETFATGTREIAIGSVDLSQRTEQQASNLQETAAAMEQLNTTVASSADSARQADQLARAATTAAARGGEVVDRVVATMRGISECSGRIGEIIGVIDSIAFQTNILALNAAVEAARAGEQGRGFAVVANEVRTLAQRSASAAREIKALIGDSVAKVSDGARLVDEAGAAMGDIVTQVKRVGDLIGEISAATQEQTHGIDQVSTAVTQLDGVTQQNAALVEQSSAAAESLKQQAESLVQAVGVFRLRGLARA